MESTKSKYDTNPLDPDYVRETEEVWGENDGGPGTQEVKGATRQITPDPPGQGRANVYSEAPTRRYDSPPLDSPYQSVFAPQTHVPPPAPYQPPAQPYQPPIVNGPSSRTVLGIGLPEKWAVMLPYAPFYIGVVVSLIELFLVPRKEPAVRFHAAQGLAVHLAIMVISTLFGVVGAITGSSLGGTLFRVAATIFLIISMIRAWKGEPHRIAPLEEITRWFNGHIEPRKPS
jgi:uncharacterized membrane protein